jgi:hypothetical protein
MSKINDGGPAFPVEAGINCRGMTLRDYFAAKAMQAYIQRAGLHADLEDVAIDAYDVADQMLKAREEGGAA